MKTGSDTRPDKIKLLQGKQLVSFNIEEYTEEVEGETVTRYTYELLKLPLKYSGKDVTDVVNKQKRLVVDTKIKKLTADYCNGEISSFWKQETEARAYTVDNTVSTPFLTVLANSRDIGVDVLVSKIIVNADALAEAVAVLLGTYQASLVETF